MFKSLLKMNDLIDKLPDKGLKCSDSQKVCLTTALRNLQENIRGLEQEDLIP